MYEGVTGGAIDQLDSDSSSESIKWEVNEEGARKPVLIVQPEEENVVEEEYVEFTVKAD